MKLGRKRRAGLQSLPELRELIEARTNAEYCGVTRQHCGSVTPRQDKYQNLTLWYCINGTQAQVPSPQQH